MMPGLAQRNEQYSFGFWSKEIDGVSYNQLNKFWSELTPKARQELLKIDKQTLFEQARKNMYCSRCNGLLLEGFLQIVMHGKSLHPEGSIGNSPCSKPGGSKRRNDCNSVVSNGCRDEMQDPSVHPWGGLTTTRDGSLTLLDCYLYAKSLKGLQNVFDSAPARERERELLYPDACGGGGRGWISQGTATYGRGHGTRETCALHTARLSCDTLVDFWSALSEETRQSLLRMKEEDFMERLRYRFDSKRFCRDCRRNVIREFKELKELKRMRREPRCTSWFCVADTAFQYEVSIDSVQADWRETFAENAGRYHHFEWAIGTGEGKSDILKFENVGMNGRVQVNGLNLRGLNSCYITLRAYKIDGRWSEVSVKAHALKGQNCVHGRLVVGDGFVSIKRGESIRRFFEHAEEAEEEEDEDMMGKDGNEIDGECSRPQKHAKSPELAREFLLDAATVIFKEQVEKAFREGTARQNAHSIFVCLTLKLLEQRVHVACKEIITFEKQVKLLEEEEKEKREEEERKEKKRNKEREKKLRRKERLKDKEKGKEKKIPESSEKDMLLCSSREEEEDEEEEEEELPNLDDEMNNTIDCEESETETGDADLSPPCSPDAQEEERLEECKATEELDNLKLKDNSDMESEETKNRWHLKDPMMNSTSSSDNCSSCLSEGDSNTVSSNNGNTESSSTSDSEDDSQQCEGRENIVAGTHNDILTTEKSKTSETSVVVSVNNTDNNSNKNMSHDVGNVQPQGGMYPQMLNQNLQFPVYQAASPMSYFHQAPPVSWSPSQANGLVSYPLPSPYLYTGPLGYSMNGDSSLCLQYGYPLNHAATSPFFNPGPAPVFHPYTKTNTKDQAQNLEPQHELNGQSLSEDSFSLFHFSGPDGLSTGAKSKFAHSKDGVLRDRVGNIGMKVKESIEVEEYNLFTKSNGLSFSLF